jgi:hypothetical protein
MEPIALSIPSSSEYEIINKLEMSKIDKAINYLKWTRSKFKLKERELKIIDFIDLNLNKQMFGWQRDEDKFIIWKHAVKWSRYAEINANNEAMLFEGFSRKKKMRRVEILFNCMKIFNLFKKMKEDRIYNLFSESNMEYIIRKAVKKKSSNISYIESKEEINSEKLFMNWRTRKKKPSIKLLILKCLFIGETLKRKPKKNSKEREERGEGEDFVNLKII